MISTLKTHLLLLPIGLMSLSFTVIQDDDGESASEDSHVVYDNQEEIDSLVMLLMNEDESPEKVRTYLDLSNVFLDQDHAEALRYTQEGLALAGKIQDMDGMLDCNLSLAHIYLAYIVDFDKAITAYDDALGIAIELGDRESEMIAYKGKSYVYASIHNYDAAEDYLEQAIEIAEELGDTKRISSYNSYLGGIYEEDGDTAKAMVCYEEVIDIEKKNNYHDASDASLMSIAHYHFLKKDMDQAIHFYRISLKRFERNSNYRWQSYTHSELARLHLHEGNFERAEAHAINGLSLAQDFNLSKEITDNYLILVDITDSLGKHELSERYQQAYDTLMNHLHKDKDMINADLDLVSLVEDTAGEETTMSVAPSMNRFLNAIIVSIPVVLLLLLMAMPARKA